MAIEEPLWRAEDQAGRLAELLSDDPEQKQAPLRRDVRSLGILLGQILIEQEGQGLFDVVEQLRQLAILHREVSGQEAADTNAPNDRELLAQFEQIIRGLSVAEAYKVAKAFSIYF